MFVEKGFTFKRMLKDCFIYRLFFKNESVFGYEKKKKDRPY